LTCPQTAGWFGQKQEINMKVVHNLYDTARGATKWLYSNGAGGQQTTSDGLTAFNTMGLV